MSHLYSTACLLARLDEPEPCVDASCDLGQDVSGIGVLQLARLRAGVARMSAEGSERRRKHIDVAAPICTRQEIPIEGRPVGDGMRRSLGLATKLHDTLGYPVGILLHSLGDLVEQAAQGHEVGPFDVPV